VAEYDFFFSYPHAEVQTDKYLMKFYDDLRKAVCRARGLDPSKAVVSFLDQDIPRGADWERVLVAKLNECRTIVPIYTPAFYNSPDCMRELELFRLRLDGPQRKRPPVLGVLWSVGAVPMPAELRKLQYTVGDSTKPINQEGLLTGIKKYRLRYDEFVQQLCSDIIAAAEEQPPLPSIDADYRAATPPAAQAPLDLAGPGHVHFVYAATSATIPPPQRDPDPYGPLPRAWRPFHPPTTAAIGPVAQEVAGALEFTSDELPFDGQLLDAIRNAEKKRNLVVAIIDGWSVQLPANGELLEKLDEANYRNLSVLVPWNLKHGGTANELPRLKESVRSALGRWVGAGGDPLRFNDAITDLPQLKSTLADVLTRLRAQVFNTSKGRPAPYVPKPSLDNTFGSAA
jgi:FxsC-like protein